MHSSSTEQHVDASDSGRATATATSSGASIIAHSHSTDEATQFESIARQMLAVHLSEQPTSTLVNPPPDPQLTTADALTRISSRLYDDAPTAAAAMRVLQAAYHPTLAPSSADSSVPTPAFGALMLMIPTMTPDQRHFTLEALEYMQTRLSVTARQM